MQRQIFLFLFLLVLTFSLTACFHEGLEGEGDESQGDNIENCVDDCGDDDPNAIYGGYSHWEHFTAYLTDAVAITKIDRDLKKITTSGTLADVLLNSEGNTMSSTSIIRRSHDDKIYLGLTAGCTTDNTYCQCAVLEIDPSTSGTSCIFQPTQEYKWGISGEIHKNSDGSFIISIARGDNSGEEIISIKDGVASTRYSNSEGIFNTYAMPNGGVFLVAPDENDGDPDNHNLKTHYLPSDGSAAVEIDVTSLNGVHTKLAGPDDTYYYLNDAAGFHRFNPSTETLDSTLYMGKTTYTADGYFNVHYDTSETAYKGFELTDTDELNPITLAEADVTVYEATIPLTGDEALAINNPAYPLFEIEINDETQDTQWWTLTNWGIHAFDLPNVPTEVDLGLTGFDSVRYLAPVNGLSVVIGGGSNYDPYFLKLYYPDAGSGALSVDMLSGVIDNVTTINNVVYDQSQHHLLFTVAKTVDDVTTKYIGVSDYTVNDVATHSGSFGLVNLIELDGNVYDTPFVFLP